MSYHQPNCNCDAAVGTPHVQGCTALAAPEPREITPFDNPRGNDTTEE